MTCLNFWVGGGSQTGLLITSPDSPFWWLQTHWLFWFTLSTCPLLQSAPLGGKKWSWDAHVRLWRNSSRYPVLVFCAHFGHKALTSWPEEAYEDSQELAKPPSPHVWMPWQLLEERERGERGVHTQLGELGHMTSPVYSVFLMATKCRRTFPHPPFLTSLWVAEHKRGILIQ